MNSLATHFGAVQPATSVTSSHDHRDARRVLEQAWRYVIRRAPTLPEIQGVQAIALHETGYGQLGAFPGSHNWGAVQLPGTSGASECPPHGFLGHDSSPRRDGSNEKNSVCFRTYPDDVAGAIDLVRNLTTARSQTLRALATGDSDRIAAAMYLERYYEGRGATPAERIAGYAMAVARRSREIATNLGEPLVVKRGALSDGPGVLVPLASLLGLAVLGHHAFVGADGEAPDASTGDLLPTFVSPSDAKRYIGEVDAGWERTDHDVKGSQIDVSFKTSWAVDLEAWRRFRDDAFQHVGWLNTKATMEQSDRWGEKLAAWRKSLSEKGGQVTGPGPIAPGQGSALTATASAGWIQLAMLVAGLFGVGYVVRGFRGVA